MLIFPALNTLAPVTFPFVERFNMEISTKTFIIKVIPKTTTVKRIHLIKIFPISYATLKAIEFGVDKGYFENLYSHLNHLL